MAKALEPLSDNIQHGGPTNREYAKGLARAGAGAIIFGLPLLMTMEMWSLGLSIHPLRLALFIVVNFAILVVLSRFGGFEPTSGTAEDVLDALGAYAVGFACSALILSLIGLIRVDTPPTELIAMVAMQAIPTSFGAMLARKQLGEGESEKSEDQAARSAGYAGELFLMAAGAVFFAFNVAPTEEVVLISFKMTGWHSLALIIFSVALLHALVFTIGLPGQEEGPPGYGSMRVFLVFTCAGYAIALVVSAYVLWTFGRLDGAAIETAAATLVVLAFPASIGAGIARLVV